LSTPNILAAYKTYLGNALIADIAASQYIASVNSFPSVYAGLDSLTRKHFGGETLLSQTVDVRGYVYTDEFSMSDSEELARNIEFYTQQFSAEYIVQQALDAELITEDGASFVTRRLYRDGAVILNNNFGLYLEQLLYIAYEHNLKVLDDCRVLTIDTDEGLLTPYGVCDLTVQWLYTERRSHVR
jgi:hypothetical protein